jgi:hypothetical protein
MSSSLSQRTTAPSGPAKNAVQNSRWKTPHCLNTTAAAVGTLTGQTNIESPDFSYPCGDCGKETTLKWNPKAKKYME